MKRARSSRPAEHRPKAVSEVGVSCIIPAYNEGCRIGSVIRAVQKHPWVDELIVVNDGSTDDTAAVARGFAGVKLMNLSPNRGKSYAVMKGIEAARNDIIMLLDADLVGLTHDDLCDLMRPVLSGEADITMSLRHNSLLVYRLIGLDFVSGERVFHRRVLGDCSRLAELRSYGLEVFFNREIIRQRLVLRIVNWRHVICVRKGDKVGFWLGFKLETLMVLQILRTVGLWQVLYQLWKMDVLKRSPSHSARGSVRSTFGRGTTRGRRRGRGRAASTLPTQNT